MLLDFSRDQQDPEIAFLGRALRAECGLDAAIRNISEVPSRSLLSRLTDHYLQIIANCAPIGFEAEFVGQRGHNTLYRGILMPLSSDGEAIDFIYGVINWKELADSETATAIAAEAERHRRRPGRDRALWRRLPGLGGRPQCRFRRGRAEPGSAGRTTTISASGRTIRRSPTGSALARDCALEARDAGDRSRAALYRALGQAYDFALAAEDAPDDYAELLAEEGLKAQARAPMTPVAKLVFGAQYDKTRLTEFAAACPGRSARASPPARWRSGSKREAGGLKAHRRRRARLSPPGAEARPLGRGPRRAQDGPAARQGGHRGRGRGRVRPARRPPRRRRPRHRRAGRRPNA